VRAADDAPQPPAADLPARPLQLTPEDTVTFTVDMHHHILPDFFWRATNEGDHPVGGIAPPP
jgi:hypothetical protein